MKDSSDKPIFPDHSSTIGSNIAAISLVLDSSARLFEGRKAIGCCVLEIKGMWFCYTLQRDAMLSH